MWANKNPPNLKKMKLLVTNLHLESLPWNNLKRIINDQSVFHELAQKKCMSLAVQCYYSELREYICSRISHIRVAYRIRNKKSDTVGILNFNLETWDWEIIKEHQTKFRAIWCAMSRDYTNFLGGSGLMIVRNRNHNPKYVKHVYIEEIFKFIHFYFVEYFLASCTLKNFIYLLVQTPHPDEGVSIYGDFESSLWYTQPTLFKLNVFNYEFDDCTTLPVTRAKMIGQGQYVYIAGVSVDNNEVFKVLRYNILTHQTNVIACTEDFEELILPHLVIKKRMLYIFFDMCYLIVDTTQGEHQVLEFRTLDTFFMQVWLFKILQLCSVEDGVMFILDMRHRDRSCDFLGLMVAHLNTETNAFKSLGFLPNPRTPGYVDFLAREAMSYQMEERHPGDPSLPILKDFAYGIKDLENPPLYRIYNQGFN